MTKTYIIRKLPAKTLAGVVIGDYGMGDAATEFAKARYPREKKFALSTFADGHGVPEIARQEFEITELKEFEGVII